jgi:hypothetical protein
VPSDPASWFCLINQNAATIANPDQTPHVCHLILTRVPPDPNRSHMHRLCAHITCIKQRVEDFVGWYKNTIKQTGVYNSICLFSNNKRFNGLLNINRWKNKLNTRTCTLSDDFAEVNRLLGYFCPSIVHVLWFYILSVLSNTASNQWSVFHYLMKFKI